MQSDHQKYIFVTNSAGDVGSGLVPVLMQEGFKVVALLGQDDVLPAKWPYWQKRFPDALDIVRADISTPESYQGFLDQAEQVIHLEGFFSADVSLELSLDRHLEFLDTVQQSGVEALIWPRPVIPSKLQGEIWGRSLSQIEEWVKKMKLHYRILHCAPITGYGSLFFENLALYLIQKKWSLVPSWANQPRQFLAMRDLHVVLLQLLYDSSYWSFSVQLAGSEEISLLQLMQDFGEALGSRTRLRRSFIPDIGVPRSISNFLQKRRPVESREQLGQSLFYPGIVGAILRDWEKVQNPAIFFDEIFHFPASSAHVIKDYISRIS